MKLGCKEAVVAMADTTHTELARAIHLGRSGHKDEALAILRRVVAGDADCVPALLWLAGLTPDVDEGVLALQHVLQLDPQNEAAMRGLAELRARRPAEPDPRDHAVQDTPVPPRPEPLVSSAPDATAPLEPPGNPAAVPAPTRPMRLPEPAHPTRAGLTVASAGRLRVVEGIPRLPDSGEPATRSRLTIGLGTIAAACSTLVCAGVGIPLRLIGVTTLLIWGGMVGATTLAAFSWMVLPLVRRSRGGQIGPIADDPGEVAAIRLLQDHLDGQWMLLRHLQLPGNRSNIHTVLTGPKGVFVLELTNYAEFTRNVGDQWQQRHEGEWRDLEQNPTRRARQNAVNVREYLGQRGTSVRVTPYVVWAGSGRLLLENPSVKVWHLHSPHSIWKEIEQCQPLPGEVLTRINAALVAKPGEPSAVRAPHRSLHARVD